MQSNMEALLMETGGTFLRRKLLGFYELAPGALAMAPSSRRHLLWYPWFQLWQRPSYSISSQPLTLTVLGH